MNEIDFLPDRLRVTRREHKTRRLWYVGVAFCVLALAVASSLQFATRRRLTADLEVANAAYDSAQRDLLRLARAQAELAVAHDEAELLTYVRHPWPRTQIIAALLRPLPEAVSLTELRIGRESAVQTNLGQFQPEVGVGAPPGADKRTPARRDLERLRKSTDEQRTVAMLNGHAADGAALHRYLHELGRTPLFVGVELGSLESNAETDGKTRFEVRLIVRPGHGQSDGHKPPATNASPTVAHSGIGT
jgi:Tfp pilus assembly protein PilN